MVWIALLLLFGLEKNCGFLSADIVIKDAKLGNFALDTVILNHLKLQV